MLMGSDGKVDDLQILMLLYTCDLHYFFVQAMYCMEHVVGVTAAAKVPGKNFYSQLSHLRSYFCFISLNLTVT